jgi:outer membrane protein assembly factor BamA
VPVEVAFFGDSGVAWTSREQPAALGGTRGGLASAGVAFRVNLRVAVAEFDISRPFQRPGQGWVFGFNMIPGW